MPDYVFVFNLLMIKLGISMVTVMFILELSVFFFTNKTESYRFCYYVIVVSISNTANM